MNQGGYFGAYRGGFQTLPDNAYAMMTAPTKQNAETIGKVASGIGGIAQNYMTGQANTKAFEQGAAAQYKGLESLSQATGVPMNAELSNQYLNIGNMSPQQQAVFNQSLGQEAQRMQMLYGINQAQARAAQAQGQMQQGLYAQDVLTRGLSAPFSGAGSAANMSGSMGQVPIYADTPPDGVAGVNPMFLPQIPSMSVAGYGGRVGPLRPMNQRY